MKEVNETKAKLKPIKQFYRKTSRKKIKTQKIFGLINTKKILIKKQWKKHFKKSKPLITKKIFYIFLITIIIIFFLILFYYLLFASKNVNLYIITHKDFPNDIINSTVYKILCDNKTQLKGKYPLEIIETYENNELYPKSRGYSEGSKIYYIWKKYKRKKLSKYVGFCHYRRIFSFKNNIPNLDKIFSQYDAILRKKTIFNKSVRAQYAYYHFLKYINEIENIIKENFTEFYPTAQKSLNGNSMNICNIFIMKSEDFIDYGEFVFGVLLEFDRRHNLKTDNDIKKFIVSDTGNKGDYQCRQEAFLMERISSIYYDYKFKNRFEIEVKSNRL